MSTLVDFKGAATVKIGTLDVIVVEPREVTFTYDVLTWHLPIGDPISMRMLREVVVLKHVRQAMQMHPAYECISVDLRRRDG